MEKRLAGEIVTHTTRSEANEEVDKFKRYAQIIGLLKAYGSMTAKQVAVAMYQVGYTNNDDRNNAAPRLTELSYQGVVEPIGKVRCEYTGKKVAVYKLIENSN